MPGQAEPLTLVETEALQQGGCGIRKADLGLDAGSATYWLCDFEQVP